MKKTIELYFYIARGLSGAPDDEYGMYMAAERDELPSRPVDTWSASSYWALGTDEQNGYPPVLMHIHYEGPLPDERIRDGINRQVQQAVGKHVFNQE